MLSNKMKWQEFTPPLILVPTTIMKDILQKPESHFVKRVNTHEGCWYHSWQDHDPSLLISNQMKCLVSLRLKPSSINLNLVLSKESTPTKDVGTTVDNTHNPSLLMSNQIKWQDVISPPLFCFLQQL